ncbi:cytochrome c oxidase, subunit VIa [Basidiobolus meristosporus CBS 931.73]|uniref:Cytochrome c oxidase subunit 13, mitochondrial n=1 Tax=Basidiobolus meristosporus CBS 931.73 TaxID=1314790 RepID=A0A1Y1YBP4_9FUNG|nr:cytochrome c oxidase, subunit VIa [Basidiobolus meristosporus CBS 931.73]|eukprot:ORX95419.1 cytochrome c oxidase, subunit VIa [Basidiobolus meristosporus CBS 931.73]
MVYRFARQASRLYSTAASGSAYAEHLSHVRDHAQKSADLWRKVSIFVCVPLVGIAGYNAYNLATEHAEHLEHHPPQFVGYPYIRIRNKPFPWADSDHSLFHNPKVNLDPPSDE